MCFLFLPALISFIENHNDAQVLTKGANSGNLRLLLRNSDKSEYDIFYPNIKKQGCLKEKKQTTLFFIYTGFT